MYMVSQTSDAFYQRHRWNIKTKGAKKRSKVERKTKKNERERERNQDQDKKRQWEQPDACLQPENRPVSLSLFVLYSSTRPGRRFIVAITQIPLAFIPSLDASGLCSITVSIYRWKKKCCAQEKWQQLMNSLLTKSTHLLLLSLKI